MEILQVSNESDIPKDFRGLLAHKKADCVEYSYYIEYYPKSIYLGYVWDDNHCRKWYGYGYMYGPRITHKEYWSRVYEQCKIIDHGGLIEWALSNMLCDE